MQPKIRIAILDSGIDQSVLRTRLEYRVFVDDRGCCRNDHKDMAKQDFCHGTICARIIETLCDCCALSSVRILDEKGRGMVQQLWPALEWCWQKNIRIVNLSLGTTCFTDREPLLEIIREYADRGLFIIAAAANSGFLTSPASFTQVVGVAAGKRFCHDPLLCMLKGIDFLAPSDHEIEIDHMRFRTGISNSYAAPFVTALAAGLLSANDIRDIFQLKRMLYEQSGSCEPASASSFEPDYLDDRTVILTTPEEYDACKDSGNHMVYLGSDPVREADAEGFLWSRHVKARQIRMSPKRNGQIDIPVLVFRMEPETELSNWLTELKALFRQDEYHAYAVSFQPEDVLCGLEYVPEEFLEGEAADKLCDFFYWKILYSQSDILLIGFTDSQWKKAKGWRRNADVALQASNKKIRITGNGICREICEAKGEEAFIRRVYSELLLIFMEEENEQ